MRNKVSLKKINKAVKLSKNLPRTINKSKATVNHNFWVRIVK